MGASLAPHARSIEVLAPLPAPDATPLPQLAGCPRLRRLTLRHVHAGALPALAALPSLAVLQATGEGLTPLGQGWVAGRVLERTWPVALTKRSPSPPLPPPGSLLP